MAATSAILPTETATQNLTNLQDWNTALARPALLVLFGGAHCGVCTALRPRIEELLHQTPGLARLALAYVDCETAPAVCAQQGVFTVPVLRLYLDSRLALDFGRHFSLAVVGEGLVRQLELHGGVDSSDSAGSAFVPGDAP